MIEPSDAPVETPAVEQASRNAYNVDCARERRMRTWFFVLIGGGFVFAAVLLALGFMLDSLTRREAAPPAIETPTPPADARVQQVFVAPSGRRAAFSAAGKPRRTREGES